MMRNIIKGHPILGNISDGPEFALAIFYILVCLMTISIGIWLIVDFAQVLGLWRYVIASFFIFWGIVWLICAPSRL